MDTDLRRVKVKEIRGGGGESFLMLPPPWTPLIIQFTRVQVELYSGVFNNVLDSTKVVSGNHAGQLKEQKKDSKNALGGWGV